MKRIEILIDEANPDKKIGICENKGSLEYKIVINYPDLNIIEERVDL